MSGGCPANWSVLAVTSMVNGTKFSACCFSYFHSTDWRSIILICTQATKNAKRAATEREISKKWPLFIEGVFWISGYTLFGKNRKPKKASFDAGKPIQHQLNSYCVTSKPSTCTMLLLGYSQKCKCGKISKMQTFKAMTKLWPHQYDISMHLMF
jgi:hypothetical protein